MKPHYLAREPALAIPLVAIAINVLFLMFVGAQLRASNSRINLMIEQHAAAPNAQLVLSTNGAATLNGSAMANLQELEFHLSAMASNGNNIAVQVPPNIPSDRLTEILQTCNRAGFTDIALSVHAEPK